MSEHIKGKWNYGQEQKDYYKYSVRSDDGTYIGLFVFNRLLLESERIDTIEHIILAANSYHGLVEALEEFADHDDDCHVKRGIYYDKPCSCGYDEKVAALLAQHTPPVARRADESKDTTQTAINDNEATDTP